ncbi:hypothetical protein BJ742DRAFT_912399 [Cladochytrium replicatum]|nr:hypothetical protein BJ742DRAFT_912399 [Cladochytrium replicatum]
MGVKKLQKGVELRIRHREGWWYIVLAVDIVIAPVRLTSQFPAGTKLITAGLLYFVLDFQSWTQSYAKLLKELKKSSGEGRQLGIHRQSPAYIPQNNNHTLNKCAYLFAGPEHTNAPVCRFQAEVAGRVLKAIFLFDKRDVVKAKEEAKREYEVERRKGTEEMK